MVSQEVLKKIENLQLKTDNLLIRKFLMEDKAVAIEHEKNLEIMRYISYHTNEAAILKKVETMNIPWKGEEGQWVSFSVLNQGKVIGFVFFQYESVACGVVEIGYRLHPDFHGKGWGYESVSAFSDSLIDILMPHKFVAYCSTENNSSYYLMEKLGMEKEAHLKSHYKIGDRWHDIYIYGKVFP